MNNNNQKENHNTMPNITERKTRIVTYREYEGTPTAWACRYYADPNNPDAPFGPPHDFSFGWHDDLDKGLRNFTLQALERKFCDEILPLLPSLTCGDCGAPADTVHWRWRGGLDGEMHKPQGACPNHDPDGYWMETTDRDDFADSIRHLLESKAAGAQMLYELLMLLREEAR